MNRPTQHDVMRRPLNADEQQTAALTAQLATRQRQEWQQSKEAVELRKWCVQRAIESGMPLDPTMKAIFDFVSEPLGGAL